MVDAAAMRYKEQALLYFKNKLKDYNRIKKRFSLKEAFF